LKSSRVQKFEEKSFTAEVAEFSRENEEVEVRVMF
jgi:hypothetical protein